MVETGDAVCKQACSASFHASTAVVLNHFRLNAPCRKCQLFAFTSVLTMKNTVFPESKMTLQLLESIHGKYLNLLTFSMKRIYLNYFHTPTPSTIVAGKAVTGGVGCEGRQWWWGKWWGGSWGRAGSKGGQAACRLLPVPPPAPLAVCLLLCLLPAASASLPLTSSLPTPPQCHLLSLRASEPISPFPLSPLPSPHPPAQQPLLGRHN